MNKKTKISVGIVVLMLVIAFSAILFVSCDNTEKPITDKTIVISVGDENITVDTTAYYLKEVLDQLKFEGRLTYSIKNGMVTEIGGYKENPPKKYIMIYSTSTDIRYANESWGTITYKDEKYASAALGVPELPLENGVKYRFVLTEF